MPDPNHLEGDSPSREDIPSTHHTWSFRTIVTDRGLMKHDHRLQLMQELDTQFIQIKSKLDDLINEPSTEGFETTLLANDPSTQNFRGRLTHAQIKELYHNINSSFHASKQAALKDYKRFTLLPVDVDARNEYRENCKNIVNNLEILYNELKYYIKDKNENLQTKMRILEKKEIPSSLENIQLAEPKNYEKGLQTFKKQALEYGSKCYSVDSSLDPERIKQSYDMYLKASQGTDLGFLVLGRKYRDSERNILPSSERLPSIDLKMIENFGVMDSDFEKKNGSVFSYPYDDWNLLAQDSMILGSLHAKIDFPIVSPINMNNLWKSEHNCMTIFAREIKALTSSGYELRKTQLEVVAVCVDKKKAQEATLRTLIEATQSLSNYDSLKEFYRSLPDEVKAKE